MSYSFIYATFFWPDNKYVSLCKHINVFKMFILCQNQQSQGLDFRFVHYPSIHMDVFKHFYMSQVPCHVSTR